LIAPVRRFGLSLGAVLLTLSWLMGIAPSLGLSSCRRVFAGETDDEREAIISGLRWFNDWQTPFLGSDDVKCTGARSGAYQYVFCKPGAVEVDIWRKTVGVGINRVFAHPGFDDGRPSMIFPGWKAPTSKVQWSFSAAEIVRNRDKDEKATERFFKRTFASVREYGHADVTSIAYPWVLRGDPEYHVYLTHGKRVIGVLAFYVENGTTTEYPNFVFTEAPHPLPRVAQRNIADPRLWFRVVKVR